MTKIEQMVAMLFARGFRQEDWNGREHLSPSLIRLYRPEDRLLGIIDVEHECAETATDVPVEAVELASAHLVAAMERDRMQSPSSDARLQ